MKQIYSTLLCLILLFSGTRAGAQCSSCTTTISTADASNYIVGSGQTLCITASGTASGLITVSPGGILCNAGTITSSNVWISGGTFNNYGSMNTTYLLVSDAGIATNSGTMDVDSLGVTDFYSMMTNNSGGTIINERFAVADLAVMSNNGTMISDYVADSSAQFNNGASGSLTVNMDFANAYNSGFFNEGYFKVTRDFYNSTGSTFTSFCIATVGRDWYNSGIIGAPAGYCGGFTIANLSLNSGTVGSSAEHVDLCDATHVGPGIDGNSGTIAATTTYCVCTNACVATVGVGEMQQPDILVSEIYPNPAVQSIHFRITGQKEERLRVEVTDMLGRNVFRSGITGTAGSNEASIDVSALVKGTYILSITGENSAPVKKMFQVMK